jgi:hypothetical protein
MNALIEAWLDAEQKVEEAREVADQAYEDAASAPLPANLRPAKSTDIVKDALIWYPEWDDRKWAIVEEVLYPSSLFKAYSAHDGCRYGLDGAFVEAA